MSNFLIDILTIRYAKSKYTTEFRIAEIGLPINSNTCRIV